MLALWLGVVLGGLFFFSSSTWGVFHESFYLCHGIVRIHIASSLQKGGGLELIPKKQFPSLALPDWICHKEPSSEGIGFHYVPILVFSCVCVLWRFLFLSSLQSSQLCRCHLSRCHLDSACLPFCWKLLEHLCIAVARLHFGRAPTFIIFCPQLFIFTCPVCEAVPISCWPM